MKILYVEDDPHAMYLTRKTLEVEDSGIEIVEAVNFREAQRLLQKKDKYDLILLDMILPDGSGMGLLDMISKQNLEIPVVMLTGSADQEIAVSALKSGATDYVVKKGNYLNDLTEILFNARERYKVLKRKKSQIIRILLADNDVQFVSEVQLYLSLHAPQIKVTSVEKADEVFGCLWKSKENKASDFDILLVDDKLSGMNVLELFKMLRDHHSLDIPVILISSQGDYELAVEALKFGFHDYLVKGHDFHFKLPFILDAVYKNNKLEEKISELARSEERYRSLIESSSEHLFILDLKGNFISSNNQVKHPSVKDGEQLVGWNLDDLFETEVLPIVRNGFCEVVEESKSICLEVPVESENPKRKTHLELTLYPIFQDQEIWAVGGIARDNTEYKLLEEEFYQAQKMECVGQLAGGVAHDFNNMISIINGYTDLILRKLPVGSDLRKDIEAIQRTARRSSDLTNQLMAFARRQKAQPRVLNLKEYLEESEDIYRRLIGENIKLSVKAAPDLWQVKIDPTQFDQIVTNLLVNSRDAIEDSGSVEMILKNCLASDSDDRLDLMLSGQKFVELSVIDSGSGMDAETMAHIFEPFFTTKPEEKGTGLGLSTVYGIIRQNRGCIHLESKEGEGTTFSLFFPVVEAPVTETDKIQKKRSGERILLVEDEPHILNICSIFLATQNYHIWTASTPNEAIELCKILESPIDLLITDVVLPEMNGKILKDKILKIKPGFKTLFMSGYSRDTVSRKGILTGEVEFIQKPFKPDDFLIRVREVLDK